LAFNGSSVKNGSERINSCYSSCLWLWRR